MTWQTVIGLEVHAQLKTKSKLFSSASTAYGAPPNSQTSYIDAALPGILPVLNQEAVHMALKFALAIEAEINDLSYFERKNYFYPDLPKGYQISQFQRPIVGNGYLDIGKGRQIHIVRAHLEEDAGKSLHEIHSTETGIDLNRAGTPLLEIVTAPCLNSAAEAIDYLKTLHQLLRFLDICDGNMQEGSFRCDVNLSLKPFNQTHLGTRTELKNLNSFRFIEKAIHYEQRRHQDILERGEKITQETRLYCPNTDSTEVLRSKENENDYRYFPDPDLLPIKISDKDITAIKALMPALPTKIRQILQQTDGLNDDLIEFLLSTPATFQFYDEVKQHSLAAPKSIVNWLKGTYLAALNEKALTFEKPPVSAKDLACLLDKLTNLEISAQTAKQIFKTLLTSTQSIDVLISAACTHQKDDHLIETIIASTLEKFPEQIASYRAGNEKLLGFFVGQVLKQIKGQGDPAEINRLLHKLLNK